MQIKNLKKLKPKKLIVFDMDGTLTPSKSPLDKDMAGLLVKLLADHKVAVISGGSYQTFQKQFLPYLKKSNLSDLFLFPVTGTAFYRFKRGWKNVYSLTLSDKEKKKVLESFERVFEKTGYKHPKKVYGKVIEDRGSQMTFSALGQDIVAKLGKKGVALKDKWRRNNHAVKLKMAKLLQKYLPELEVRAAAYTSIDITKKGVDKAYGIRQMEKHLGVKVKDMVFVGDAIFPGGNDYVVTKTKVDYVKVKGPAETKKVIREILKKSD